MSSKQIVSAADAAESIESAISQNQISAEVGQTLKSALESGNTDFDDAALSGCQGVDIDDIDSEDVTLVACVIDASGSMYSNRKSVIDAYNQQFLQPLQGAKNARSILVTTWIFSSGTGGQDCRLLHGYTPIPECKPLTEKSYDPNGGTPLFDAVSHAQTGIVAYGQTLRDGGTRTKCIIVVLSDGENNDSQTTATAIRRISKELMSQEIYVLSYIFFGIQSQGDGVAKEIGFPPHHRLTAGLNDSEIRRVFGAVSASVISTSQAKVSAQSLSANAFFDLNP